MLHILNENKDLKEKRFRLGINIKKYLCDILKNYNGDKTIEGYKRLNNIIDMDTNYNGIAYNEMKRIKNWFDSNPFMSKTIEYKLNGGDIMKNWVNSTLIKAEQEVKDWKESLKKAGKTNVYIKPHTKERNGKVSKLNLNNKNNKL